MELERGLLRFKLFLSTPSARRATAGYVLQHRWIFDFYPRPPRGGRLVIACGTAGLCQFLSTPSARRATQSFSTVLWFQPISIHALREEGDYADICTAARAEVFLSTPSARRATPRLRRRPRPCWHFYPRPPRGGRLYRGCCLSDVVRISIHALREEGDSCRCGHTWLSAYFYPRPPRGGRPRRSAGSGWHSTISIHALREEGDGRKHKPFAGKGISIHALREEGDSLVAICVSSFLYFYPRPPRGGRRFVLRRPPL